jgi:signal transduction histidine kinase
MTLWLALSGWAFAAAFAIRSVRIERRLQLVAQADHELRGPVCALSLAVEALGRHPELRRRAAALDAHLDRLRLGLADLEAARAGRRAAPRPREVRLDGLARAATEAWAPAVRNAGGELSFEWRAGPVVARADRARLSQALGNVLANAVEHGGRRVAVVGDREGEDVRIAVHDSGTAVPWRPAAGRGRGLSIAARAVEGAHGSLEAPELLHAFGRRGRGPSPRGAPLGEAVRQRPGAALSEGGKDDRPRGGTEVRIELPLAN